MIRKKISTSRNHQLWLRAQVVYAIGTRLLKRWKRTPARNRIGIEDYFIKGAPPRIIILALQQCTWGNSPEPETKEYEETYEVTKEFKETQEETKAQKETHEENFKETHDGTKEFEETHEKTFVTSQDLQSMSRGRRWRP